MQDFLRRVSSTVEHVRQYQDDNLKSKALEVIPIEEIYEKATLAHQERAGISFEDHVLRQLLRWFKESFFKWVNQPNCETCTTGKTRMASMARPTPEEQRYLAGVVEVYQCESCSAFTRFPRYNHAGKLLETRRGRCGEWAQAFTLCCTAMGFEARYVLDWTDHVWTEVYSVGQNRWLHCDSCENVCDSPLMYEAGWGKKLNYIIAFSTEEVVDVTKRYTHKWNEVLTRRTHVSEEWLKNLLLSVNSQLQIFQTPQRKQEIADRRVIEDAQFQENVQRGSAANLKPEELVGRISGSTEWKESRGETGTSSSSATCTIRPAVPPESVQEKEALMAMKLSYDRRFSPNDTTLRFIRNASAPEDGSYVRLTPAASAQRGALWHSQRINIAAGFTTEFEFRVSSGGADGFAFVLQNDSLSAIGGDGCELGYAGIDKGVAIEFDTYRNWDTCEDPNDNHISVMTSRDNAPLSSHHSFCHGCITDLPRIATGQIQRAKITYWNETLHIYFGNDMTLPVMSIMLRLGDILRADECWVGFTAATGGISASHDIVSWTLKAADSTTASASTEVKASIDYVRLDAINLNGVHKKLLEFNSTMPSQYAALVLSAEELESLQRMITSLQPVVSKAIGSSSGHTGGSNVDYSRVVFDRSIIDKLLRWPKDKLFPVFDLVRVVLLNNEAATHLSECTIEKQSFIDILLDNVSAGNSFANRMCSLRVLTNLFLYPVLRGMLLQRLSAVLEAATADLESEKANVKSAFALFTTNIGVYLCRQNSDREADTDASDITVTEESIILLLSTCIQILGSLISNAHTDTEIIDVCAKTTTAIPLLLSSGSTEDTSTLSQLAVAMDALIHLNALKARLQQITANEKKPITVSDAEVNNTLLQVNAVIERLTLAAETNA